MPCKNPHLSPACCCTQKVSPVTVTSFSVCLIFLPVCLTSGLSVQDETQVRQSRCFKVVLEVVVEKEEEEVKVEVVVVKVVYIEVVVIVEVVKGVLVIEVVVFAVELIRC